MGSAGGAAGQNRQAEGSLDQPGDNGEATQAPAVECAHQHDGKGLHGHGHGHHRHFDIGRGGQEQRARSHDDEPPQEGTLLQAQGNMEKAGFRQRHR
ncbi:hypothetical protein D3C87_1704930 [compost metagenome]